MEHHRAGSNGLAYFGGTRNSYAMSCGWPPSAVPQDENKEMDTHVDAAASPLRHGGSNPPGSIAQPPRHTNPVMRGGVRFSSDNQAVLLSSSHA